ncbi:unnamed protein product [Effrenium voratum]|uniref:Aspartyl/asparaginy/proline hydroxylase domain-containing protein n=1 Tax=Effrenium voratum TaxID=2562239 RepID=A0AA36N7A0_9DINO|nr:unnamed protein product [Effrenium voratum]CAJ1437470.1 unnamed protein product [Effrenium voratum]CAJ1440713.1 unnamed protein product [Effrenium voratum]
MAIDGNGQAAVIGSDGWWLCSVDFVWNENDSFDIDALGALGFPRDWPKTYSTSAALKSLIGKRGRAAAKRVAVAGLPTPQQLAELPKLTMVPMHSFQNAERAAQLAGLGVVRGWAVFERLDRAVGEAFVAERYWWNTMPDGTWIDLSPRPSSWPQVLLVEPVENSPKPKEALTRETLHLMSQLLRQRFPDYALPKSPPAVPQEKPKETVKKQSGYVAGNDRKSGQKASLDYSKFDKIEDSDDEKIVPKPALTLPMGLPREAVSRQEYDNVWRALMQDKQLPYTPAPDLDQMWGYYKYGGMDEQALLDQACEVLGKFPCRLDPKDWKGKTYSLTKKLELESREDEARMWSIICILRFPDADAFYNQGVLLNKMCDKAKFGGATVVKLPALEQSKMVPVEQYCSLFSRAAISYYRRSLKVDPKQRPAYINLIGSLERNEPANWYDEVHELAIAAVRNGIWYTKWQRSPHFVPTLTAKPFHDGQEFALARALEENYPVIKAEYVAYREKLANRKDWDDSDTTPGLGDVGNRAGALHDGGLRKSGKWQEVPLFTNCTIQREYTDLFPETTRILQTQCADATGLAFCGGGDVIFSVLTPGTRLRPHCGPSNARLTCHLGITVPRKRDGCFIRVAAEEPRGWEEGRCLVFDDSFEHEVVFQEPKTNETYPGERVVLLANFWHPDFSFKNDPDWRQRSDEMMASVDVESLPQTAMMKT